MRTTRQSRPERLAQTGVRGGPEKGHLGGREGVGEEQACLLCSEGEKSHGEYLEMSKTLVSLQCERRSPGQAEVTMLPLGVARLLPGDL